MNKLAKEWVQALRSRKFKQGTHALCSKDGYCCLGVLCEVSRVEKTYLKDGRVQYLDKTGALPFSVARKVELSTQGGDFSGDLPQELKRKVQEESGLQHIPTSLIRLNDTGVSFATIADVIEAEPEGLFNNGTK